MPPWIVFFIYPLIGFIVAGFFIGGIRVIKENNAAGWVAIIFAILLLLFLLNMVLHII